MGDVIIKLCTVRCPRTKTMNVFNVISLNIIQGYEYMAEWLEPGFDSQRCYRTEGVYTDMQI